MKQTLLFSTAALLCAAAATADQLEQQKINERLSDSRIQVENPLPKLPNQATSSLISQKEGGRPKSVSMSKEELANHPDLVIRALLPAVTMGNMENVALLFPIYQKLPPSFQDPLLTRWAEAILAKQNQNYRLAIKHYREILAQHSGLGEVRFQLAITLFENNELEAAEDQFKKLRSENLPTEVAAVIDQYLNAINRKDRWTFNGGLTYLYDPNINNAPKAGTTYGNWTPPQPEKAQGIGFNFDVGKKWSWGNGFFNELRANTSGKYYWNNKKYNETSLRGTVGIGFQNARVSIALLPFMEQNLYAGGSKQSETLKRFSKTGGAGIEFSYWLSPKWQWTANYEYGEQRYISRKHLNGNSHFISTGLVYLANAKQYLFVNLNYNRTSPRDRDDSFFRRGVSVGWGQEWGKGLSTRLSFSVAQKRYKGAMPIFNIVQRNKEYGIQASIWHRAVHFWGITPRLTYNFTRTRSNHVFYSYDKHRAFIDFSKQF